MSDDDARFGNSQRGGGQTQPQMQGLTLTGVCLSMSVAAGSAPLRSSDSARPRSPSVAAPCSELSPVSSSADRATRAAAVRAGGRRTVIDGGGGSRGTA